MSTFEHPVRVRAERRSERALFKALFDDAAIFPPGLTPLPQAAANHAARQASSYADLVGPLLLPASAIEEFLQLGHPQLVPGQHVPGQQVALVGRPGTDLAEVAEALSRLNEQPAVTVTGVEIGWSRDWHRALGWGVSLSVEVPRGAELGRALSDVQAHADDPSPVQAKFRTGSTPQRPAPSPTELATFIRACVDHDLAFKLTGGLHHALSGATSSHRGTGVEDHLGFLNVIAATRWALAYGAGVPEMDFLLCHRDPAELLDIITRMSEADAAVARAFFTSYGCCGVIDPISDLAALGLITEMTE